MQEIHRKSIKKKMKIFQFKPHGHMNTAEIRLPDHESSSKIQNPLGLKRLTQNFPFLQEIIKNLKPPWPHTIPWRNQTIWSIMAPNIS
jgi:hypothetical protein